MTTILLKIPPFHSAVKIFVVKNKELVLANSSILKTSLWPKKEEKSHVYIGLMRWNCFLEENAAKYLGQKA